MWILLLAAGCTSTPGPAPAAAPDLDSAEDAAASCPLLDGAWLLAISLEGGLCDPVGDPRRENQGQAGCDDPDVGHFIINNLSTDDLFFTAFDCTGAGADFQCVDTSLPELQLQATVSEDGGAAEGRLVYDVEDPPLCLADIPLSLAFVAP